MTDPKLSIIIPCFNSEMTLRKAIDSCYSQGFENNEFEIIIVDDGSNDNTKNLIKEIAQNHDNIRYQFHKKNLGGGAARNTAVKYSRAEVIFCLDSDDILPFGTMLKMYSFLKQKNCDGVAIHRSIKFTGDDVNNVNHIDISDDIGKIITLNSLFDKHISFFPIYVTFMFTRKAFMECGTYPTSHGFDTQGFGWRFLSAGKQVYVCPDSEYFHRVNFNKSYYLREYYSGKTNYNLRDIFLEHYYVFDNKALDFILTFDCRDFTKNILDELRKLDIILKNNFEAELGKKHPPFSLLLPENVYVRRNSLLGLFFRIRNKIRKSC